MPKKYFTKFLPVEGEIKADDNFIMNGQVYYCEGRDDDKVWYDGGLNMELNSAEEDECSLAKLFLCSKPDDVKVGTKLYTRDLSGTLTVTEVTRVGVNGKSTDGITDGAAMWYQIDEDYVVAIGQLSPAAIWIKEGMEFDEEEFTKTELWFNRITQKWNVSNGMYINYAQKNPSPILSGIAFKCPICKTFH